MKYSTSFFLATCNIFLFHTSAIAAKEAAEEQFDNMVIDFLKPGIGLFTTNPWIQGFAVIIITFALASILTILSFRVIKGITSRTKMEIDDRIATILRTPVYITLIFIGIGAGMSLMPLPGKIQTLVSKILPTINVIIWTFFFIRFSSLLLNRLAGLRDRYAFIQHRTLTLFDNLAKVAIFLIATYFVFVIWNINMSAWLASAGVAGIAIGFAAKDTLSNLFSGVFIIADAPYKVGDYVVLDKVGRGKIMTIGLRSTRILTRDDYEVTVPNSIIGNSTIVNQSGGPYEKMRIRLKIGVAYGSDVDKVTEILQHAAESEDTVCRSPKPRVRFRVFGASSLDFELLFWVENPEMRGIVLHKINTRVYKALNANNIEIPYTKQDVYIKSLPEKKEENNPSATQPELS